MQIGVILGGEMFSAMKFCCQCVSNGNKSAMNVRIAMALGHIEGPSSPCRPVLVHASAAPGVRFCLGTGPKE